jgi:hypothetical protein
LAATPEGFTQKYPAATAAMFGRSDSAAAGQA